MLLEVSLVCALSEDIITTLSELKKESERLPICQAP